MQRADGSFRAGVACVSLVLICLGAVRAQENDPIIDEKPVSQLLKQLRSDNRGLQMRAAQSLAKAATNDMPAIVPQLIPILKSERENDRFVAAQTLGNYGPVSRAAVPELVPLLKGTQYERNRAASAKALGQILKDAQPSEEVDKVTDALTVKFNEDYDPYSDVRREAVHALGMIGPAAKNCIPKLTRGLTDFVLYSREHQMVRQESARTCGRMGPLAAEHMDRLISMMHAEGHEIPEIVEAIGLIGPIRENVIPNIIDKMEQSRDWGGFIAAALKALERFGPKSAAAAPMLLRWLRENRLGGGGYYDCLPAALRTLAAIGPAAKDAAPEVLKYVTYSNYGDWQRSKEVHDAWHKELHETAAKAYTAITGQEPPTPQKK